MKNILLLTGLLLSMGYSGLALALTLQEAKSQGLVGEKVDGFISAVVPAPTAEVQALIASTNEGRQKVYAELAQRNGITEEEVGILSAEKLRASAKKGEYVQQIMGQWQRIP